MPPPPAPDLDERLQRILPKLRALFRYNPADWYPPLVMGWAERYGYGARVVWPVDG